MTTCPPEPRRTPQHAHLVLASGGQVLCTITEDPELDHNGMRVFYLDVVRELRPDEAVVSAYIDVLPARSRALVRWTSEDTEP